MSSTTSNNFDPPVNDTQYSQATTGFHISEGDYPHDAIPSPNSTVQQQKYHPIGHARQTKSDSHLRLYIISKSGIHLHDEEMHEIMLTLQSENIDLVSFVNGQLNTSDISVRRQLRKIVSIHDLFCKPIHSSASTPLSDTFRDGGVVTLLRNAFTSRLKSYSEDRLGRWTAASFAGRRGKIIHVISVLQPLYRDDESAQPQSATGEQRHQLSFEGFPYPLPQLRFHEDLCRLIDELTTDTSELILMGDFWSHNMDTPSIYDHLQDHYGLVDAFRLTHQHLSSFEQVTVNKSPTRILMTQSALLCVRQIGSEPPNHIFASQHRGLFVDLDLSSLFHRSVKELLHPSIVERPAKKRARHHHV